MQLFKKTCMPINELSSSGSTLVNNAEIHKIIGIQQIRDKIKRFSEETFDIYSK